MELRIAHIHRLSQILFWQNRQEIDLFFSEKKKWYPVWQRLPSYLPSDVLILNYIWKGKLNTWEISPRKNGSFTCAPVEITHWTVIIPMPFWLSREIVCSKPQSYWLEVPNTSSNKIKRQELSSNSSKKKKEKKELLI